MRLPPLLLLLCWLGLSPGLHADEIEYGELVVHSSPGQNLRASIPISLPAGLPLSALRFSLADAAHYQQQGLVRPELFDTLQIALLARGEQRARIQLFAERPWQGEALSLLLQIAQHGQFSQRLFVVQPIQASAQPEYIRVGQDETLDSVALRLGERHSRSYLHMMYALYQANPQAFFRDNMNNLRSGVQLRIPSTEELYRFDDAEAFGAIRAHQARKQSAESKSSPPLSTPGTALVIDNDARGMRADLQQLSEDEARFAEQNRALREQLLAMESRVQRLGNALLDDLGEMAMSEHHAEQAANQPEAPASEGSVPRTPPAALPNWLMLSLFALVILSGILMQRRLRPVRQQPA
jgi:pilus assembly protein FimV